MKKKISKLKQKTTMLFMRIVKNYQQKTFIKHYLINKTHILQQNKLDERTKY